MGIPWTEVGERSFVIKQQWSRTMKSHHAIALALIGWYLITPPSLPNGSLDLEAPLGRWDRQQLFASSDECKNGRERLLNLQAGPGTPPQQMAEMRRSVLKSRCVADEDPRLEEK